MTVSRGEPPPPQAVGGSARRRLIWLVSAVTTGAAVVLFARMVDAHALSRIWLSSERAWIATAVACGAAALLFRASRLRLLLDSRPAAARTFGACLRVTCLHQSWFTILPSGTGDLSLPLLLKNQFGIDTSESLAILLLMRLQDAVTLLSIGAIAAVLLWMDRGAVFGGVLAVVGVAAVITVHRMAATSSAWLLRRLNGPADDRRTARTGFRHAVLRFLTRLCEQVPVAHARRTAFWTIGSWLVTLACIVGSFRAFGVRVSGAEAGMILLGLNVAGAAAFFTIAGLGIVDAGLLGLIAFLGIAAQDAFALAVAVRAVLLLANVGLPLVIAQAGVVLDLSRASTKPTA
jgi:glycosyltransferase 2 family protein